MLSPEKEIHNEITKHKAKRKEQSVPADSEITYFEYFGPGIPNDGIQYHILVC
jgi:hypothetical protein